MLLQVREEDLKLLQQIMMDWQIKLVLKVGKFNVDVDTNHPYAGRTLEYQIEVLGVRNATEREIAQRRPGAR